MIRDAPSHGEGRTLRMPLASMSKVTSTLGTPCAGGRCRVQLQGTGSGCSFRVQVQGAGSGCRFKYRFRVQVQGGCRFRVQVQGAGSGYRFRAHLHSIASGRPRLPPTTPVMLPRLRGLCGSRWAGGACAQARAGAVEVDEGSGAGPDGGAGRSRTCDAASRRRSRCRPAGALVSAWGVLNSLCPPWCVLVFPVSAIPKGALVSAWVHGWGTDGGLGDDVTALARSTPSMTNLPSRLFPSVDARSPCSAAAVPNHK
jgi:hypothetical protein